jgi:hypothetical protein
MHAVAAKAIIHTAFRALILLYSNKVLTMVSDSPYAIGKLALLLQTCTPVRCSSVHACIDSVTV